MNGWTPQWIDKDGKSHGRRPSLWTDTDERELALFLRSKRLGRQIIGADVVQYDARMDRHIDQLMERVQSRLGAAR